MQRGNVVVAYPKAIKMAAFMMARTKLRGATVPVTLFLTSHPSLLCSAALKTSAPTHHSRAFARMLSTHAHIIVGQSLIGYHRPLVSKFLRPYNAISALREVRLEAVIH